MLISSYRQPPGGDRFGEKQPPTGQFDTFGSRSLPVCGERFPRRGYFVEARRNINAFLGCKPVPVPQAFAKPRPGPSPGYSPAHEPFAASSSPGVSPPSSAQLSPMSSPALLPPIPPMLPPTQASGSGGNHRPLSPNIPFPPFPTQAQRKSRFSPPHFALPLPTLDVSVLARMYPPPPPAVIAAAVIARAAAAQNAVGTSPPIVSPLSRPAPASVSTFARARASPPLGSPSPHFGVIPPEGEPEHVISSVSGDGGPTNSFTLPPAAYTYDREARRPSRWDADDRREPDSRDFSRRPSRWGDSGEDRRFNDDAPPGGFNQRRGGPRRSARFSRCLPPVKHAGAGARRMELQNEHGNENDFGPRGSRPPSFQRRVPSVLQALQNGNGRSYTPRGDRRSAFSPFDARDVRDECMPRKRRRVSFVEPPNPRGGFRTFNVDPRPFYSRENARPNDTNAFSRYPPPPPSARAHSSYDHHPRHGGPPLPPPPPPLPLGAVRGRGSVRFTSMRPQHEPHHRFRHDQGQRDHYQKRRGGLSHRFDGRNGNHFHSSSAAVDNSRNIKPNKDAPAEPACRFASMPHTLAEGCVFPVPAEVTDTSSCMEIDQGDSPKQAATVVTGVSTSGAYVRTRTTSFSKDADDDAMDTSADVSDAESVLSDEDDDEVDAQSMAPAPLLYTVSVLTDMDPAANAPPTAAEAWVGEYGGDASLPFYDAPTVPELILDGAGADADGWIADGADRETLEQQLRSRRLICSYSELQNPDSVRALIRPLADDLRALLAAVSGAKQPQPQPQPPPGGEQHAPPPPPPPLPPLHRDDEAFLAAFRNQLIGGVRGMQRGSMPYIGSLYS